MRNIYKIALCVSALLLLVLFSGCGKSECSVKDFTQVTVTGYKDHGQLSVKADSIAISKLYNEQGKDKTTCVRFSDSMVFSFDGMDEEDMLLSNGDVVTISVSYDEELAKKLGLEFVDSSFEYKIEGLEDKLEMSPFEGLSVKFNGVAPYGTVHLDKSNCIQYVIDNVTFYCDNRDLSNGDKIVVRAEFSPEVAEKNGYIFTEDVKKYTVVGLSKYVKTMNEVSYGNVTAYMHRMAERYLSDESDAYKSLAWYFGEEDSDTDYAYNDDGGLVFDELDVDEDDELFDDGWYYGDFSEPDSESSENDSDTKGPSDIERIKSDFTLCNFDAEFDFTPINCYYSINSVQLSDNIFYSAYKVTGKFVCTESGGSGYINKGDVLVGEIYVLTSLSSGSVDIKNVLVYDSSVMKNYNSYSYRSFSEFEDLTAEVFGVSSYLTETLPYNEDQEAYDNFEKNMQSDSSRSENAHIDIDTSTEDESDTESDVESALDDSSSAYIDEYNSDPNGDGYNEDDGGDFQDYYDNDYYYNGEDIYEEF